MFVDGEFIEAAGPLRDIVDPATASVIAIEAAIFGVFTNQGEICSAGSRILVDRRIYRDFVDAMVARARQIRLGPPADSATHMGPLISGDHLTRVMDYVALGRREAGLALLARWES